MNNNEVKKLSAMEWMLSIAGILFLLTIIVLPPVFREVFKEKVDPDSLINEMEIKTLVCTKDNFYSEGSRNDDMITITYYNDKPRTYSIRTIKQYEDLTIYDNDKQSLGLLSSAYEQVDGIELSLTAKNEDLKLTTIEKCIPGTLKSTVVTIGDEQQEFKVNPKYSTTDSVKQIKMDLEDDGYKCKVESK